MMSKKNDSFPQKNASPKTVSDVQVDTFEQETSENGGKSSIFFNKTSLIGTGVLVIALVSVAIPYSLGWFTPTPVAETEAESEETDLPPTKTEPEVKTAQNTQSAPIELVVNKVDDSQETVDFANYYAGGLALPDVTSLPGLDDEIAETERLTQLSDESDDPLFTGTDTEEPAFGVKQVGSEFQLSPAPKFTEAEPVADVPSQPYEQPYETENVQDFAPTALTEQASELEAVIDIAAINTIPTHTEPTPLKNSSRQLNVAKHDPNPDTVHQIDENDYEQAQESNATFSTPQDHYSAQSFPSAADNLAQTERITEGDSPLPTQSLLSNNEYQPKYAKIRQGSQIGRASCRERV